MKLVIVESPTKARTIGRFLGKGYEIKASMGHIMDLPKSRLGVDVDHDFLPQYELVSEKKMITSDLKESGKKADSIILATDPDREGEAIAAHVKEILFKNNKNKVFKRIVFHEITKEAVLEALKNPRDVDENLVDAQTARRVLDRLVGYQISPVLWRKIRRGLSAGRVQSVALRLIVEREREIEKFKKEKYWTVSLLVQKEGKDVEFELIEINKEKIEKQETLDLYDGPYRFSKTTIDILDEAKKIAENIKAGKIAVSDVSMKEIKRSPHAPFTTSSLQQEASRRFGFAGRRTMTLAQKLYEEGFITYHRTDSVTIATSAVTAIRKYAKDKFGNRYVPEKPRFYQTKQKLAQEAHEAIRPTKATVLEENVSRELGKDFAKLYDLIWKRAVASQMADAVIESTTVLVDSGNVILSEAKDPDSSARFAEASARRAKPQNDTRYRLKTNGSVLLFDGFLKLTPQALSDNILPEFTQGEELPAKEVLEKEHETLPPPRYNDASIIATLEEKGIGRPSTYASIMSTIQDRRYIERIEARFVPTPIGIAVNDFLVKNFSTIDDIPFTAEMEDELDAIANEKKEWVPVIKSFYSHFKKSLEEVRDADRVKIETEETDEKCPKCGANLVIRYGKFGKFLSCSTFPACDFTKPFVEEIGIPCPKCGGEGGPPRVGELGESRRGQIILRKTRKGRKFYGCSNYPKCTFAAWKLEDVKKQGLSS